MNNKERIKRFCKNCLQNQPTTFTRCPFARKDMCPELAAFKTVLILEDKDTALMVPTELLLKALRLQGYTGELRKVVTVTI